MKLIWARMRSIPKNLYNMSNHSYNIYYGLHMCHIKDIDKNKITKNLVTN